MKKEWLLGWSAVIVFFSCGAPDEKKVKEDIENQNTAVLSGKQLSLQYCQSCHLYPEPNALDKNTWERSVLPLMGRLFGIYEEQVPRSVIIKGAIDQKSVLEQNIFPQEPQINEEDWQKITDYYLANAPDSARFSNPKNIPNSPIEDFEVLSPLRGQEAISTTLVKVDSENSLVYIGGSKGKLGMLTILNTQFEVVDEIKLPSPPTDVHFGEDYLAVTLAGVLRLGPSNNAFGELIYLLRNPGEQKYSSYRKFAGELNRPVQSLFADINGDGTQDILIAEFGYYTGSLTLFKNSGNQKELYKKEVLKNTPGAIRVEVEDMNGNGLKDIVALFAQGDERIAIFYNDGNGGFKEEVVLRFSPSYGSVYFELVDMNDDGFLDILYCNGDNGDYPPILKDYHGLRVFENDGNNNFKEVYFYPMYGAFKASAEDFNLDGNMDIIAISYFPDTNAKPRQDLVYLQNKGGYSYIPQFLEKEINARWITFDIADIDGDGYQDVLVGAMGGFEDKGQQETPILELNQSLILLKNLGKKNRIGHQR